MRGVIKMKKATLHLMVGLPCSGKTTTAKQLEKDLNLVRLTPDEWQLQLFGDDFISDEYNHNIRHKKIEDIMWNLAKKLLINGVDVILDYGFWAKEERMYFFNKSKELNISFEVHYMDIPLEELLIRLDQRNKDTNYPAFYITKEHMIEWNKIFEPVTDEELTYYKSNK